MQKNQNFILIILGFLSYFIAYFSYGWYEYFGGYSVLVKEHAFPVILWLICCLPILKAEKIRDFWWVLPSGAYCIFPLIPVTFIDFLVAKFVHLCWSISGFAP